MEQNNVEMLEEIEQDLAVAKEDIKPELKEYEKLLLEEKDRKDLEKALGLIGAGCFSEVENEPTLDFNKLELVPAKRKLKGLYDLYRNKETGDLLYVSALIEDNKGEDNVKEVKPYGYKVLYIESMDDATYELVMKAAKNNIKNGVSRTYKAAFVLYFVMIALTVVNMIYIFIQTLESGVLTALASIVYNCGIYFVGILLATILLVPVMIRYKKYKAE